MNRSSYGPGTTNRTRRWMEHPLRRHAVTMALAAASLAAALPTAQAYAATPAAGPATSAPPAADGGVHARAGATDAQQRAFWAEQEKKGTLREFKGQLKDWKPKAEQPKAKEPGAARTAKAPATAPRQKGKSRLAAGSPGENWLRSSTGRIRIAWPDQKDPGTWWVSACTGNVINSDSKDTIATARHCIPHDDQGRINPKATYEFTPGYSRDADGTEHAPNGKWTFRSVGVVGDFANAPQTSDTAFLTLNTQDGTHVQDKVGASGFQFGLTTLPNRVLIAGIPAKSNQFHTCAREPYWGPDNPPQILGKGGPCSGDSDLSGGASGGPLVNGDTLDSGPVQIGNFSGSLGEDAAAAVWRDAAYAVFRSLQGQGQGQGQGPAHDMVTTLTNANNKLADLYEYRKDSGSPVYGYHNTGGQNQQWHLWDKGDGYFLIESRYTEQQGLTGAESRVLDYNFSNGTAWSHRVNDNGGSDNQFWRFRDTPGRPGWYTIRSKRGDQCLGAPDGEGSLTVASCGTTDGLDSQQWKLDKVTTTPAPTVPVTLQMVNAGGYDPNALRSWFDRSRGLLQDQYGKIKQFMTGGAYEVKPGINVVFDAGHPSFSGPGVAAVFEPNAKPQYNNEKSIILRPDYVMRNQGDTGSLIHELTHQVQDAANGGWLNEGQADYYRKYVFDVKEKPGVDRIRGTDYKRGYDSTAFLLNYIAHKHAAGESIIQKINNEVRRQGFGADGDRVLTTITGKDGRQWWTEMWNDIQANPTRWTNPGFHD
ncbi:RICIN domain-containing protein [Streptomyces cinnamoneus]|uniref:basic secretory protein-like protein n=1 Tax=Streptomyces cinnamoneus TaxID=53446 RepID=UPI0033E4202A